MKFNVKKFAMAAGLTSIIFYSVLQILALLLFSRIGSMMNMQINMRGFVVKGQSCMANMFSPFAFLFGLLWIFIVTYCVAALFAWMSQVVH